MMENHDSTPRKKYRWRNKWVTESVYRQRLSQSFGARKRKSSPCANNSPKRLKLQDDDSESKKTVGRRLINVDLLAKRMVCECGSFLLLQDIEEESRSGLASIFKIRCRDCLFVNSVSTDIELKGSTGKTLYETNTRLILGIYDAGMGCTHLNKLLGCLDMPSFNNHLFQNYELEIGIATEKVAKKSCENAVNLERNLTLQNLETLQEMLPDNLEKNFLLPDSLIVILSEKPLSNFLVNSKEPADRVRIMVSYDMGWSKRGSGRNYDSNNGYGALIGVLSGCVLEYGTKNRKCRRCELGHSKVSHNCRLNYSGSSKEMESSLAVDLITKSRILENARVEVGVLVGDDDSSTIAAVRLAADRKIVKFSDMNHTNKGVKKHLYNIQKEHKELTKDAIEYLQRCFSYAVVQNKGNKIDMANSIRQIPDHAFNNHQNCGQWCGYQNDKDNYQHKIINSGFIEKSFYKALIKIFNQLADNVDKFANATSSQLNENLNAIMASKSPKSRCYNLSFSADFRFAMAIASKNLGSNYIPEILKFMRLSSGQFTEKYLELRQRYADRRKNIVNTPAFKRRRNLLKRHRTMLRKRKEKKEGATYESAMGLLDVSAVNFNNNNNNEGDNDRIISEGVVFFDIETASFSSTTEILQIAAKYEENLFEIYITPTEPISAAASNVNHLTSINGELFYHKKRVPSKSILSALQDFHAFLKSIGKPCVFVAHNCNFDKTRLLYAIKQTNTMDLFSGFTDTLPIFKRILNRKKNCSQTYLAKELLGISDDEAHNAVQDVIILNSLVEHLKITEENLKRNKETLIRIMQKEQKDNVTKVMIKTLIPLQDIISTGIKRKMAEASITFNNLVDTYMENGRQGLNALLSSKIEGKVRVTKNVHIIDAIHDFLDNILIN